MSKAKRSSFKAKAVSSSKGRLNFLHMDLCGPMRDETPEVLKDFLTMIQHNLQAQNGVVERRNRTLVEAARTMLSASKLPLSFWAEAVTSACYTQNISIIISTHGKTAYHIINDRKPSIKHLHIFGCICYITKDGENLDKMKEKGDPCVMVGYSTQLKGYCVYNKRTRLIVESIHIKFDEIKEMMSDHNSSDLAPQRQEMSVENVSSGLVPQGQKASDYDNSDPVPPRQNVVPTAEKTDSSQQGLEFLFSPLLEEYYNPTHGLAEENNNDQAPNASFQEDEFINPFCTRSYFPMTRDHPLEQVRGNPTMPVQTRRQLATDPEMCMFALTDKLHQFDRLKVWELVDKPFGKMIIEGKCYAQEEGIDFEDHLAPVARIGSTFSDFRCPRRAHKVPVPIYQMDRENGISMSTEGRDADHARCLDTRKSTSGGITVPWCKLVSWMSKETKLHCNVFSEAEYGGVIAAKLCSCNVDETQL
ncbi:retrovirus-related pol polyprotein from transposon TNT 1-94 [Tanacetum coccineum]|uniref:Retrovirus-related pol polyprotein from transposon TNT 1-94 n=1 Tax=Tanacetum coccineum TaxID=301880 RepID=A0ABQ5F5X8_9ASTR